MEEELDQLKKHLFAMRPLIEEEWNELSPTTFSKLMATVRIGVL